MTRVRVKFYRELPGGDDGPLVVTLWSVEDEASMVDAYIQQAQLNGYGVSAEVVEGEDRAM